MDIFLIILGSICLLVGLAGCIVPMLPGPPVSYLALVFLHFTDKVSFTIPQLFFWLFIVVLIQILDYFIPMNPQRDCLLYRVVEYIGCLLEKF